jgi:DNA-binding NtrC family response regulator
LWEAQEFRCRGQELHSAEKVKMGKLLPNVGKGGGKGSSPEPAALAFVEGVSASMRPVEAVIRELAQSDVPVLVLAEVGAGKHATAQRIHQMSRRSTQPFRWFQCLGLEAEDLEVLHEQGNGSPPNAGTIYLEELADLNANCQTCLL